MMNHTLRRMALAALALCGAVAASPLMADKLPYWQDLKITAVGAEAPRTDFIPFSHRQQALTSTFEQSPYYLSLNGTWQFYYTDSHRHLPAGLTDANPKFDGWSTIQVPGNWEVQGFGTPLYVNQSYEFCTTHPQPPQLPQDVPVGIYRRTFTLPAAWSNRDVFLQIEGAKSGCYVYLNGQEVGYAEDSKNPATYRLNPYLREGENVLTLQIFRWSTGSFLECQDFWRLSGLERDVFLFARTPRRIDDFRITSTLDSTCTEGLFRLAADLGNHTDEPNAMTLTYELLDPDGRPVASGQQTAYVPARGAHTVCLEATLPQVEPWSSEHPHLYRLLLRLQSAECVEEYVPVRVGFRRIEIKASGSCSPAGTPHHLLYINGQPIKLKGVNLHEHNPQTGHYVSEELMRRDLTLMKQANINTIRLCHYPQSRRFYELCDELGFYIYDEANIESHGMYYDLSRGRTLGNNPEWLHAHLYRTANMFERNKNHPCVTFWSLGNEAGNGYNFYQTYLWLKQADAHLMARPVNYERALWEWNTDMYVPQYPSAAWLEAVGHRGSDRPVVPSEYAHAMGNSTGGLADQWRAIWRYPHLQGGYIWDWGDQGLLAHDAQGTPYYTYGGDYGTDSPSDGNFCCNGLVAPDRTLHPGLSEVKYVHQDVAFLPDKLDQGAVVVRNRFYFTNLNAYRLNYCIKAEGQVIRSGSKVMDVAPQAEADWPINLSGLKPRVGTDYFLELTATTLQASPLLPAGFEVARESFRLPVEPLPRSFKTAGPKLRVEQEGDHLALTSSRVVLRFDRSTGHITSYRVAGTEYLYEGFGFQPNFWRAPTDNDYGNQMPLRLQVWKEASRTFRVQRAEARIEGADGLLSVSYLLPTGNLLNLTYRLQPSGVLHVDYDYQPTQQQAADAGFNEAQAMATYTPRQGEEQLDKLTIPRLGIRLRLPQSMNRVRYFGHGPDENYTDRCAGSPVDLYETTAERMGAVYVRPQENGHRTGVRWLQLSNGSGRTLTIYADSLMGINVLRQAVEDLDGEEATHRPYQWRNLTPRDREHREAEARNRLPRQTHMNDVPLRPYIEINLDHRQMGVGGYDSWGAQPDPQHQIPANQPYHWGFTVEPR